MPDLVGIYNMALGAIGAQGQLTSTTDPLREAEVCNLHYGQVRKLVFSMAWWPSLRATARLALSVERDGVWDEGEPAPRFRYAYSLPSTCVRPRFLDGYVPFIIERTGSTKTLQTNVSPALLTYTELVEDPNEWDTELVELLVAMLAVKVSMPIRRDPAVTRMAEQQAQLVYERVVPSVMNAEQPPYEEALPPELVARNENVPAELRYVYPLENFTYGTFR